MSDEQRRTNILLEELMSQFRIFGEGLQLVNDKVDKVDQKVERIEQELVEFRTENRLEHNQLRQMIGDLDMEVKRLDTEVIQIKRVKWGCCTTNFLAVLSAQP